MYNPNNILGKSDHAVGSYSRSHASTGSPEQKSSSNSSIEKKKQAHSPRGKPLIVIPEIKLNGPASIKKSLIEDLNVSPQGNFTQREFGSASPDGIKILENDYAYAERFDYASPS